MDRPAKISWRLLFKYLMNREELEYHLDSDVETYGERYKANPDSRWNTPEFAALAADAVRKLQVLQSTKLFWAKTGHSFSKDMKLIAQTTDKDFEAFQYNLQRAAIHNVPITTLISQAKAQGNAAVQRTLQHVLMHTATTAFSEGAKTTFRHMGQAMNDRFGPFSTFFTTNFADTYHVLTQVLAQGAFEPLGRRPLNILQDSPPMPTSQEMHKIVAARPMVQANLFLFLDAITHQNLLCARRVFLGRQKYDPCFRWAREPLTEDDFTSSGDFGISAFLRSLIKALEAQGRGFAHGHENHHSEPRTKAIDLVMLFLGRSHGTTGATEHSDDRDRELLDWMARHRDAHLRDAATKQFDSAVESGRQFGCTDLKEVFTADEKKRCRLDGGADDDGTPRLPNVEVVPAPDPGHVLRERHAAEHEGRPLRHAYRDMPLTGAPAARFPSYLQAGCFDRFPDLDENGHAAATLAPVTSEHCCDCDTGWIDPAATYVTDGDGKVCGFRKVDGGVASANELEAEAKRYAKNFSYDVRFCHVYNHSHVCKPTCFKNTEYKKPSAEDPPKQRQACRFRFWRFVRIAESWFRRMGKALVPQPTVATEDDEGNEFGRCNVCRANCFRGSTNDLCQVCLRCNVDYQYQNRSFPDIADQPEPSPAVRYDTQTVLQSARDDSRPVGRARLPRVLRGLTRHAGIAVATGTRLLSTFAVAMRSSSVANFYATKYLAKPQQWLATALGPLISGYRRVEEEQKQAESPLNTKHLALRKMRTAIFAAFRSVWISSCEACLFIQTGGSAILSHPDVVVHGHKGLFMMHECKRILNKQVAGEGLWYADLAKAENLQDGEVAEVRGADTHSKDVSEQSAEEDACSAPEHTDSEDEDAWVSTRAAADVDDAGGATQHSEDAGGATEHSDGLDSTGPAPPKEETDNKAQIFQVTISLRDDWLHRGDALQDMDLQTYAEYIERRPKPIRGQQLANRGRDRLFAFDGHYRLAQNYMQLLVPASRRKIARFNMTRCEKENVNEGEENAQFKAMHCALVRCSGPGSCADPLMCAGTLFPNAMGEYRFATAWRARESEIKVLAMRGFAKKLQARRFEGIHDTTLCKVLQSTVEPRPEQAPATPQARTASTLLQIDLQRWFRQGIRDLRVHAKPESPCTYGYYERMVHDILLFLSGADGPRDVRGMPMWHEEQLHLAEWQALQQLEYLFNLTLSVDAKNLAIEKLKAQKKTAADADAFDATRTLHAADDDQLAAIAAADDNVADVPMEADIPEGFVAPAVTDKEYLLRLLNREDEVALAKRPGQGRREALQFMRQAAETIRATTPWQASHEDPSVFGAAEHERQAILAQHQSLLERLRQEDMVEEVGDRETPGHRSREERVDLIDEEEDAMLFSDPATCAKHLCDRAELTREQRGPVALVARAMQQVYDQELARRDQLTDAQRRAEGIDDTEGVRLPLVGRCLRLLFFGGGGCGKTRIINAVLAKLFRRFYGPKGLVLNAFANKPARLIGGTTTHGLIKSRGGESVSIAHLRVRNDKQRRALAAVWAPAGALVKDEFTQQPGALEHALAVRAMYGRERYHRLRCEDYARPQTNYASMPFVVTSGDPLQFPPVPAVSSLLAEPEGQTKEHRIAQAMFEDQDYVCELRSTMRFQGDPALTRILAKIRTPGEDRSSLRLTDEEWRLLQNTDVRHGASLDGTEAWYMSAFSWAHVCMAQWNRSMETARATQQALFLYAAKDYICNVDNRDVLAVRDLLLKIPNMNTTGRLPAVLLVCRKMPVRCTVTVCRRQAPVDTTGIVQHVELHPADHRRWQQEGTESIFVLHHPPTILVKIDDNDKDTGLGPGIIAVAKQLCEPFTTEVELTDERCSRARLLKVRVRREQVPLTIATASTLYTLQGTTAEPGLIYYFNTPRRISKVMKWITCYMALSRVRSLSTLRSVGLTSDIRDLLDLGPPDGFYTRFLKVFGDKISNTQKEVEAVLAELGWND